MEHIVTTPPCKMRTNLGLRLRRVIPRWCRAAALALSLPAGAAQISDGEFAALNAIAVRDGAAFVVATLATVPLAESMTAMGADLALVRARKSALLTALGEQAWSFGQTDNQLGQVGLFLTPTGLQILRSSTVALKFRSDVNPTVALHRSAPGFTELLSRASEQGLVDVRVRVRNEGAQFDIAVSGLLSVSGGSATVAEHQTRAGRVLNTLRSEDVPNLAQATADLKAQAGNSTLSSLELVLRVRPRALLTLATHADVASVKAADEPGPRVPVWEPRALEWARQDGYAHVLLLLRDPTRQVTYSPTERARAVAAKRRAMTEVLRSAGVNATPLRDIAEFGVYGGVLSRAELERLHAARDLRLAGVDVNVPVAEPMLNRSPTRLNTSVVWSQGYQGAYFPPSGSPRPMRIAVLDTGVAMTHPMLVNKFATENSVLMTGCSGTNSSQFPYRSRCRGAPPPPDQPGGVAGRFGAQSDPLDGAPPLSDPHCTGKTNQVSNCDHGTQVAAIAAGSAATAPSRPGPDGEAGPITLSGIAPAARVVPVNVFSWHSQGTAGPRLFSEDLLAALQGIATLSPQAPELNDWVVTLSVGSLGTAFSSPCASGSPSSQFSGLPNPPTNETLVTAIGALTDLGIPVIIAAGNDNFRDGLSWPACLPGAIKVSSTVNPRPPWLDVHEVSQFSANKVPVGAGTPYSAATFFVAPGGTASRTFVGSMYSATANTAGQQYGFNSGTSFAAPHVAGAYAVVKAAYRRLGLVGRSDQVHQMCLSGVRRSTTWSAR
jgi:hypothetical protein